MKGLAAAHLAQRRGIEGRAQFVDFRPAGSRETFGQNGNKKGKTKLY